MSAPELDWPDKLHCLHPTVKSFGEMIMHPERKEYIRRDPAVLADLPEVQAMLAAKLEEAWRLADRLFHTYETKIIAGIMDAIRDRITPDMSRSLEAVKAAARREGMERAAGLPVTISPYSTKLKAWLAEMEVE
jgi:hypothetical protein